MSYRYDKEKQSRRNHYLFGSLLLVLVFFTPLLTKIYDAFERVIFSQWEQVQDTQEAGKGFFALLGNKQSLIEKNQLLQDKIDILEVDVLRTKYLESVLESYETINQEYQKEGGIVSGEIIARYPKTPRDTFVINKGSQDGVVQGNRVVAIGNLAIGTIEEVYDRTSRVRLYTDNEVLTQAVLYGKGEGLTLTGTGNMYRSLMARESEVAVGDVAYTQDTPGMILAVVQEVVFDPRDPMKQVYLSLPVNLGTIQAVAVLP